MDLVFTAQIIAIASTKQLNGLLFHSIYDHCWYVLCYFFAARIFMMITIIFMLCVLNINNNNILLFRRVMNPPHIISLPGLCPFCVQRVPFSDFHSFLFFSFAILYFVLRTFMKYNSGISILIKNLELR